MKIKQSTVDTVIYYRFSEQLDEIMAQLNQKVDPDTCEKAQVIADNYRANLRKENFGDRKKRN